MLPVQTELNLTLHIVLAAILAGVVGFQRHHIGHPAGVRTHALVAMAAVCFTLVGMYGFGGVGNRDVTRVAAQVVTGVGFLGAGTIFQSQDRIYGLTTAASLWFAAALGLLIGAELVLTAIISTGIALVVLTVVRKVEELDETD